MTKKEIAYKLPDILNHKIWGYAELEFIEFSKGDNRVGIVYRHETKRCSYATIANSWLELYQDIVPHLKKEGHIK